MLAQFFSNSHQNAPNREGKQTFEPLRSGQGVEILPPAQHAFAVLSFIKSTDFVFYPKYLLYSSL
jgi:hypothetical protein